MGNKEQINTLVATGGTLPPVNPDLYDTATGDDDDDGDGTSPARKKPGRVPANATKPGAPKPISPDPKEYIAELERPEDENVF